MTIADPTVFAVAKAVELNPFVGRIYQAMGAPPVGLKTKAFKIFSRTLTSRDGVIGSGWTASATSGLGINADALKGLTVGHQLDVGGEVVVISAVDRSANTISVLKRGDGATTAKSHASGDAYKVIGFAGNDTDLKNVEAMSESTKQWENYVQTVFEAIEWTKHGELMREGMTSANATVMLIREAMTRSANMLSRMAVLGIKQKATGATERYFSAGLLAQLRDGDRSGRTYNVNGILTEVKFKAALKTMFDAGGAANTIWVSPTTKPYINAFLGAFADRLITDSANNHTAGGIYVDSYNYEGAILKLEVDNDMPDHSIAVTQSGDLKKAWLEGDGFRQADEPSLSSRETRKSLQGSVGFYVENVGANHVLLTGITGGTTERSLPVTVGGGVAVSSLPTPVATYQQIDVNADADVPAAAAANIGLRVKIATAWSSGTKIVTAAKGEVWASNGAAWVKQA